MSKPILNGRWTLNHKKCIDCGTTERPHGGKGLCSRCRQKARTAYKAAYARKHYGTKGDRHEQHCQYGKQYRERVKLEKTTAS